MSGGETLLSLGLDLGTSTTQLVLSRLTLENRASAFSVPRIAIGEKEIVYRSAIHFTPLVSETVIDADGIRAIVAGEYRRAGVDRGDIQTGAVIITGETARKENARQVLTALSGFAGDFVVATAGPDLESILAARGAGIDEYSKENKCEILHFDIGGGTSNLARYRNGALLETDCLDIGGRRIKVDRATGRVTAVTADVAARFPQITVGRQVTAADLVPVADWMARTLLEKARDVKLVSFSGGVADCIRAGPKDWLAYGDIGVLLGRRVGEVFGRTHTLVWGRETIGATVVGAGSHATELSGSTIFYRGVTFPLKNLPVLRLEEADLGRPAESLERKLAWFRDEDGLGQVAVALKGQEAPGYGYVTALAAELRKGLDKLLAAGHPAVILVERDMAKALGHALWPLMEGKGLVCLDSVSAGQGDYIDLLAPAYGGTVLPVVVKTLAFDSGPPVEPTKRSD